MLKGASNQKLQSRRGQAPLKQLIKATAFLSSNSRRRHGRRHRGAAKRLECHRPGVTLAAANTSIHLPLRAARQSSSPHLVITACMHALPGAHGFTMTRHARACSSCHCDERLPCSHRVAPVLHDRPGHHCHQQHDAKSAHQADREADDLVPAEARARGPCKHHRCGVGGCAAAAAHSQS